MTERLVKQERPLPRLNRVQQILADLVAEQQALDQYLQSIKDREWAKKTPAKGWDVRDQVSHLAWSEEYAYNALEEGGSRLAEAADYQTGELFTQAGVDAGRRLRPQEVIEWWRGARAKVVDSLSRKDPADRIPWFAAPMGARAFATARLMETWAHGLDIHHTFGDEPEDTPRLRHIAWLGWRALPYAFGAAGEPYEEEVGIEVIGPDFAKYSFGPTDGGQVIRGSAGEWCRVAVQRLAAADTGLKATGEVAETALRVARAYV